MTILSNDACFEILESIKSAQWRIEIIGEEWYDGDAWHVVIKGPMHDVEAEAKVTYPKTLNDALNEAIANLRKTRNGRNILFAHYRMKKSQSKLNSA
jgi:hypothetical protein